MSLFDAIIIGLVEGLTEFLPISSTGHMIVISSFLGLPQDDFLKGYEVVIQVAAIAAVVVYYRRSLFASVRIWTLVIVGSLPVLAVGYVFADYVKMLFSVAVVAVAFIVGGIIFLLVEYLYGRKIDQVSQSDRDDIVISVTMRHAVLIGFAQIFSLVPGMSRSGATIIGGLLTGLSRHNSATFSFFLAIPVILVVAIYDFWQTPGLLSDQNVVNVAAGFVVAFTVAYAALHAFVRFLERHGFAVFGWYRIIFGVILLLFIV